MKLLNTLITAFAFALPFSTPLAQPVKVDVPLGIQMGDKLEDIPLLQGLEPVIQGKGYIIYRVSEGMKFPSIFKLIFIEYGDKSGVCSVGLSSSDAEDGDVVREGFRLTEKWLSSKYGAPEPLPNRTDNLQKVDNISVNWGGINKLQSPVQRVGLSHFIVKSVNSGALDLTFEFENWSKCKLEEEGEKLKEFENL